MAAPKRDPSDRISPTAHYTAWVWVAHGLSPRALGSPKGQALHAALRPLNRFYDRRGRTPSLDAMLLVRHRLIDHLLCRAIEGGELSQVLEVAAGFSGRGLRLSERYRHLRYVEADLPFMVHHKRAALRRADPSGRVRVVETDALAESGELSLRAVAERELKPAPFAVVTEGLLPYLPAGAAAQLWRNAATAMRAFGGGVYLSDLHLRGETNGMRAARAFQLLLAGFTRGRVHLHHDSRTEAEAALVEAGFDRAQLHHPSEHPEIAALTAATLPGIVRVLEGRVTAS